MEAQTDGANVIQGLRQANYQGDISVVAGTLPQEVIEALGSAGDGVKVPGGVVPLTDTGVPQIEEFRQAMSKYVPSGTVDSFSETAYAAVNLFAKVADTAAGEVDAKTFLAAANASTKPIDVRLIPPWTGARTPR